MSAFARALIRSQIPVAAVAGSFIRRGYEVWVPALHVPDNWEDSKADAGDLKVRAEGETEWRVIEVKGYNRPFEVMSGYSHIVMDKKTTLDAKDYTPSLYVAVPEEMDQTLILDYPKHGHLKQVRDMPDQQSGRTEPCYVVPRECWGVWRIA